MSDAAWLPVMTAMVLGGACIAIAWAVATRSRRASAATPAAPTSRAATAATLFFLTLAGVFFLDAATVDHPLPLIATALRAVAALAGIVAALSLRAAPPSTATTDAASTPAPDRTPGRSPRPSAVVASSHVSPPPPPPPSNASIGDADVSPETGFLGLVSHELRTPLTAMHLLLDRLVDAGDEVPAKHRKTIERLSASAIRLTDLVDSLLYYARIRSGRFVSSAESFDLSTVASDAAEELRPQAERKALVFQASRSTDPVSIESDPKLVRLVIVNLVSNAVKFTDHGRVAVTVSSEGDNRVVRVTDSGAGIPAAEQERIFEPFQNLAPTKHKHLPGIGLGLSLARQIVDNLGGRIAAQSEPGRGSTFEVFLPAVAGSRTAPSEIAQ